MEKQPNLLQILSELGLTEKEAKVLIAVSTLGSARITDVAKESNLKRPTIYLAIDELIKKNLIGYIPKGKIRFYQVGNIEKLVSDQLKKITAAKTAVAELQHLHQPKNNTKVALYEGKEKISHFYEQLFRSKQLWGIVYLDEYWKLFGEEHNRHLFEILKRHGGIIRNIVPKTKAGIEYISKKYRNGLQETRFLAPNFDIQNNISIIFNDKYIAFTSFKTLSMTVIQDPDIVRAHKQLWQTLWNQSLPLTNEQPQNEPTT